MHILIIYLIKVAIFQALLLGCYYLLLRRDTFYKMNRYYFMGGLFLSLIIPALDIDIKSWFNHEELPKAAVVYEYIPNLSFTQIKEPWWHQFVLSDYLLMIIIGGALLMLARLLIQYLSLKKISVTQKADFNDYNIKFLDKSVNPFSFGKTIYLNPVLHSEKELEEIIEHELVHILQKHSIDIIVASLNKSIFWWNPAAWLLNKAIRDNLEYIADRIILEKGFDRKHYQYHLLQISQLAYSNSIAHHFNFSNLKKRIVMMNKKETSRYQKMKWLLLIPVAAIQLLAFNYRENLQQQIKNIAGVTATDTIPELPRTPFPVKPNSKGNYVDVRNYNGECIVVVESNNQDPIARIPLTKWNADEKKYTDLYGEIPPLPKPPVPPAAPRAAKATRPPYPPAAPQLPESVASINIRGDDNFSQNKNSHKKIATVTLKNGKQETYDLNNDSERSTYEKKYGILPPPPPPPPPVKPQELVSAVTLPENVLVLVDGKEATKAEITKIPAAKIATVQVFKDETAIREYGDKGKNGVIKITTKIETAVDVRAVATPMKTTEVDPTVKIKPVKTDVEVIGYKINPVPDNKLYVVDGVETNVDVFNVTVKPEEISSINVLKGEQAAAAYGEKGKNGVILVKTKKAETKPVVIKPKPVDQ